MRFAFAFGLLGGALLGMAARSSSPEAGAWRALALAEIYLAVCFLSLAMIYGLREAGADVENLSRRPVWSAVVRVVLLPYLLVGAAALYGSRWFDREGLLNPVAPGLFIGRLPFPFEAPSIRAAGIGAVLNLCWEFPRLSGLDEEPGIETARAPILDGSPPSDRQFREAIQRVERWRAEGRRVFVHCAQGHGRTATITAAILIRLGLASNVEEALSMIAAARPLAKPSRQQRAALCRYVALDLSEPR